MLHKYSFQICRIPINIFQKYHQCIYGGKIYKDSSSQHDFVRTKGMNSNFSCQILIGVQLGHSYQITIINFPKTKNYSTLFFVYRIIENFLSCK